MIRKFSVTYVMEVDEDNNFLSSHEESHTEDVHDLVSNIKGNSAGIALSIAESSGFTLACPDVMIDNSKTEVSDFLMQNIPFRGFAASESANMVSITIS